MTMRPDDPDLGPRSITIGCVNFEAVYREKAATLTKMLAEVFAASANRVGV